jgi:hypothetical protein
VSFLRKKLIGLYCGRTSSYYGIAIPPRFENRFVVFPAMSFPNQYTFE